MAKFVNINTQTTGKGVIVQEHVVEQGVVICAYHGYLVNKRVKNGFKITKISIMQRMETIYISFLILKLEGKNVSTHFSSLFLSSENRH